MSSLGLIRWRALFFVAPLLLFSCFTAEDDTGDESDDGDVKGCRDDGECRLGRVCVDLTGDRDNFCETGEDCACAPPGTGGSGGSSSGGSSSGGASNGGNAGCTMDTQCSGTLVCVDSIRGDGDDFCEENEVCECRGAGTGGTSGTGNGGASSGGASSGGSATGGAATGGSSGGGSCGAYCARLLAAMCAATTEAACLGDCGELAAECPSETTALSACVANPANPVSCQAGQTVVDGCDSQIDDIGRCAACVPQATDTSCGTCSKTSCCDEFANYNLAPDVDAFYACASACTTTQCFDACVLASPVAGTAYSALAECQDDSCVEPCICGASTSDDACDTCYKSSCCTEYAAYVLSPNALEFENCALDCADDTCFEACVDQYPAAGASYLGWVACIDANCATDCAP
jgi:hypothetical protein